MHNNTTKKNIKKKKKKNKDLDKFEVDCREIEGKKKKKKKKEVDLGYFAIYRVFKTD